MIGGISKSNSRHQKVEIQIGSCNLNVVTVANCGMIGVYNTGEAAGPATKGRENQADLHSSRASLVRVTSLDAEESAAEPGVDVAEGFHFGSTPRSSALAPRLSVQATGVVHNISMQPAQADARRTLGPANTINGRPVRDAGVCLHYFRRPRGRAETSRQGHHPGI